METPEAFVEALDVYIGDALRRIGERSGAAPPDGLTVAGLLRVALRNELEAAEEAALWMSTERALDVKLALARQCGDEARHYRLIEARLRALGVDLDGWDPLAEGPSPMYTHLAALRSTVERVAAGPFAREALAQVRNEVFIGFCEAHGDAETAALYREVVQPDEAHHHALGRRLLLRLAVTPEDQALARAAVERTLALAEELQEVARLRRGIACAPGC
ncbi:MAG: ferritin-like domain-containing protein [Deltaproteobacteria bacterium]|nr:ferritin-like domain-containing protein [Deltaproteobacteria bacterium]